MATGKQQDRYRALFPLWFFKKKYIEINNKALGRILILKQKKNETILILFYEFQNFKFQNGCKFCFRIDLNVTINDCFNIT